MCTRLRPEEKCEFFIIYIRILRIFLSKTWAKSRIKNNKSFSLIIHENIWKKIIILQFMTATKKAVIKNNMVNTCKIFFQKSFQWSRFYTSQYLYTLYTYTAIPCLLQISYIYSMLPALLPAFEHFAGLFLYKSKCL